MNVACVHAGETVDVGPPADGCVVCLEEGGAWVHLRQCLVCARTLCCDNSPGRHMTRHWEATGHPVMRSAQPGEGWTWCYPHDSVIRRTGDGWETFDMFVDMGMRFAARHLGSGGSPVVDSEMVTDEGFPLGDWVAHVREQRRIGELDPGDATAIEGLPGWTW